MPNFGYGFRADELRASVVRLNSAYSNIINVLYNNMQSQFVDEMSKIWACKQAQEFFRVTFKPRADWLIDTVNKVFSAIIAAMNNAGVVWATTTGDVSAFSKIPFYERHVRINIDSVKENINGERGIDKVSSDAALSNLTLIYRRASAELNAAVEVINRSEGFLGGNQQIQLKNVLGEAARRIEATINNLVIEVSKAITATVEAYGDAAGKIATEFSGFTPADIEMTNTGFVSGSGTVSIDWDLG